MKFLSPEQLKQREPNDRAKKALLVAEEGIVDYKQVMEVMAEFILSSGGEIYTNNKVLGLNALNNNSAVLKIEKVSRLLI